MLSDEDRAALDSVLVYLWSTTGRAGSNSRQSQIDYGKRKGAEVVEAIVARNVTAALNDAAAGLIAQASTCPDACELCEVYVDAARHVRSRIPPP